jgi:DNA-binding response OmpR family regulator
VLDLGLPGMDGLDVARELRRTSTTPIVGVTARGEETDRIVGLELGGDDYLVEPFSPKELAARVRAVLRRTSGGGGRRQAAGGRRQAAGGRRQDAATPP